MTRTIPAIAWQQISACLDVTTARLSGRCLRRAMFALIPPGQLTPDAALQLHASIQQPIAASAGPDTIWYVVSVDGTPVAWLTRAAAVITPAADLSTFQLDLQQQAAAALSQLTRSAILELAALRDQREQRIPGDPPVGLDDEPTPGREPGPRVLVADPADPTLTFWSRITPDPDVSCAHLAAVTGMTVPAADGGTNTDLAAVPPRILNVHGYGRYADNRDTFDLTVLCAIERLAADHDLPAAAVGDWLRLEAGSSADPGPEQITAAFADAYTGLYPGRRDFTIAERDRLGWTTALAAAGIPDRLFDLDAFTALLFDRHVHGIPIGGRLAVFRRMTTLQAA
ncbi:hypothetical protein AB0M46_05595 [Dactylosporangium sp. NPDC051485]|uniref:hypothetical protein n=1 Tax=Dactylosporangium sp. NPDC051485 TaxID=3154846 RepID=UPI00343BA6E0